MSDIKNIKLKLESMKGFGSITKGDILDLITTIESQKEEIEKLKGIQSNFFEVMKTVIFDQEVKELTPMKKMALTVELLSQKGIFESNQKAITELKNEEIQGLKNVIEREQHYANTLDADLKKQTSITELAVKGLGEIKMMLDMDHSGFQKYQIWKSAFDTLSEIERLSQ